MSNKAQLAALLNEVAEMDEEVLSAPPAFEDSIVLGDTEVRFTGYVEIGEQKPFKGNKGNVNKAIFMFDYVGANDVRTIPVEGVDTVICESEMITCKVSGSSKSTYMKLLTGLKEGSPGIDHPSQALGTAYLATIGPVFAASQYKNMELVDNAVATKGKGSIMDKRKNVCTLASTMYTDRMTKETVNVPVREAINDPKLFMWNAPSAAQAETVILKASDRGPQGFIVALIKGAVNYFGSKAADVFGDSGLVSFDDAPTPEEVEVQAEASVKEVEAEASPEMLEVMKAASKSMETETPVKEAPAEMSEEELAAHKAELGRRAGTGDMEAIQRLQAML